MTITARDREKITFNINKFDFNANFRIGFVPCSQSQWHFIFGRLKSRTGIQMDRSCIRDLCKCCQQCAIYTIYDCINAVISSYLFIVSHAYIKNTQHIHKQTQRATEETKRTRTYVSSCDRKIGVLMVSVN